MAYAIPTAATFKAKFPTFAAVADATIDLAITEAAASLDQEWAEADYAPATMYLAAHIMVLDGVVVAGSGLGDAAGMINAGMVSDMKVGDVQVKLGSGHAGGSGSSMGSGLGSTGYGRRYLELLRRNKPAVAIV